MKHPTERSDLPEGWDITLLGDLIDQERPITYGVVQPGDHDPKGIPLVRGGDFSAGWRPLGAYRRVAPNIERAYSRARLRSGDLVITIKGDVGTAAIVPEFLDGANISQTNARLAIDGDKAEPELVLAFLQSEEGRRQIKAVTQIGAQPGLIFRDIANFAIALPPLHEQREIIEILRRWDEAIETSAQLIKRRERQSLALTLQLVFGQRRFARFGRSSKRTEHRWFDVPSDWRVVPIGRLAFEVSERNGDQEDMEVLSCSKYQGFVRSLEYFKKQVFSGDLSGYKRIWRGDLGFPSNHIEEGSIGIQDLIDVGLVSPIYTVFRFDPQQVDSAYAFATLKTSLYRHIFEVSTSASVDRRGSLRWSEFSKIPVPVPPLEEQQAISAILAENRMLIDGLKAERDALERQKRGLMQKLLTGEWRVTSEARKDAVG